MPPSCQPTGQSCEYHVGLAASVAVTESRTDMLMQMVREIRDHQTSSEVDRQKRWDDFLTRIVRIEEGVAGKARVVRTRAFVITTLVAAVSAIAAIIPSFTHS